MKTKLKFKVGDKVRVKSLEWYNEKKNEKCVVRIDTDNCVNFTAEMSRLCGEIMQVEGMRDYYYIMNGSVFSWQDWMLEDEVVNEEKEEVEQSNQSDMETKEMTKEEVLEFLGSTKILCTSTEETAKVQEKLFELGIVWMYDGQNVREDKYLLFINQKGNISYCSEIEFWMKDVNRRIEPTEILAIQIKEEEKPKFDPKTLQAFDKVLVRDNEGDRWRGNLFCHIKEELGYNYFCIYDNWKYCIPYNEETKHLVGTTEEAPEFYNIWE